MLIIARSMSELSFEALMKIYIEGNTEHGIEQWPGKSEAERLALAEQDFYRYLQERFFVKPDAVYALWVVRGKYVSALRLEPNRDGLLMEALETAPEERRKGYATALIHAVQNWIGRGKIYSHVSKLNTASLAAHRCCGFHMYLNHCVRADGTINENAYTMCYEA